MKKTTKAQSEAIYQTNSSSAQVEGTSNSPNQNPEVNDFNGTMVDGQSCSQELAGQAPQPQPSLSSMGHKDKESNMSEQVVSLAGTEMVQVQNNNQSSTKGKCMKRIRKHKPLTAKEFSCFIINNIIKDFVLDCLHDSEEKHTTNTCVYHILDGMLRREYCYLNANLAFICSKLNCQTKADLAEVLHVSKSTIYRFWSAMCWTYGTLWLTPADLARKWESQEDK